MNRYPVWIPLSFIAALSMMSSFAQAGIVYGVGANFPKQVYLEWGKQYKAETGSSFAYFARGSGKGVESILSGKSDFGASDKPLTPEELAKHDLVQFPALIGGIVPVFNIQNLGDGQLQLDGPVLANIFLGKIKRWNDPAIVALNPGVALPRDAINVIHRSDKSGSTFVLTDYLFKVSAEWKASMGAAATEVNWKVGVGVDGTDNLAKQLVGTPNSISYMDLALIQQKHLAFVKVRNHDGVFVSPQQGSFIAAASNAKWNSENGYGQSLTDQAGAESWPITTATYIILSRKPVEVSGAEEALKYFDWSFRKGSAAAQNLGFVSIPVELMQNIRDVWKTQIKDRAGHPVWR
jgi:phosphate transport system substrate-binding protein